MPRLYVHLVTVVPVSSALDKAEAENLLCVEEEGVRYCADLFFRSKGLPKGGLAEEY